MSTSGTVTIFRRRCGKPACRGATGEPHESPALTYSEDGRTETLTLGPGEVAEVQAALARYEQARAKRDRAAHDGIVALRGRRAGARTRSRRR